MKLIFGLGNPGREYAATRHNVGYDTITRITDVSDIRLDYKKHKGLCGKGILDGERVVLIQPLTYMNLSGECVRDAMDFYKLTNEDIIVIYDDCSLEVGQLRIRKKGSAGGHNGIKNIIQHLGTDEFVRIKVGIGEKPSGWDLKDYVLGRFTGEDNEEIRKGIAKAAEAVSRIITSGADSAMNEYNQKPKKEKTPKAKDEQKAEAEHKTGNKAENNAENNAEAGNKPETEHKTEAES